MSARHLITEVGNAEMIVVRVTTGIKQHFQIRISEWLMVPLYFAMYYGFMVQPDMFSKSPSFYQLRQWATEETWATLLLVCGLARLVALIVNGTFQSFPYSPHIRMATSTMGAVFWSQFSLGFLIAYIAGVGAFSAVAAYATFTAFELANLYRSSRDVGHTYADIKRRQQENGLGL
jgi:hypothetical protein